MKKRGQTTIFIVVALLIVVVGVLVYLFVPEVRTVVSGEISPNSFLKSCVEEEIVNGMERLSKQGGYANPEGSILYQGNQVKYLCYTAQYHTICNVQQPLIKAHFEQELSEMIDRKTDECVSNLKDSYESRSYDVVSDGEIGSGVVIVPEKIVVNINAPITISKGENIQSFTEFNIEIPSKMYDLLMISTSIIDYESTYGDAETLLYIQYYPNLIMEKTKLGDGSTIYKVGDAITGEEFTFASRSLAWPGGYGFEA